MIKICINCWVLKYYLSAFPSSSDWNWMQINREWRQLEVWNCASLSLYCDFHRLMDEWWKRIGNTNLFSVSCKYLAHEKLQSLVRVLSLSSSNLPSCIHVDGCQIISRSFLARNFFSYRSAHVYFLFIYFFFLLAHDSSSN